MSGDATGERGAGAHGPSGPRRLTALERAQERLAQGEIDLAQNARERVWLGRLLLALPIVGGIAWIVLALVAGRGTAGVLTFAGAVGLALVTYGTGMYMTAVRRREFGDAIRDARAEIAQLERLKV
ncbi:MAG: hypothetical protein LW806_00565 [Planctomycetaceae bacterium]|nr:hypothetical protein [Planctomycetaceae bacterium]